MCRWGGAGDGDESVSVGAEAGLGPMLVCLLSTKKLASKLGDSRIWPMYVGVGDQDSKQEKASEIRTRNSRRV